MKIDFIIAKQIGKTVEFRNCLGEFWRVVVIERLPLFCDVCVTDKSISRLLQDKRFDFSDFGLIGGGIVNPLNDDSCEWIAI